MAELTKTWQINKRKYSLEYQKNNYNTVVLHFNRKYEGEIIEWLESTPNKTEFIKQLIEQDMKKR